MDLRTSIGDVAGHRVLTLDGVADLAAAPSLHDALARFVDRDPADRLAVDLDGVSVLDDTALGLLLGAAARARANDCEFTVICSVANLRARLSATRFDQAVSVAAALAAPGPVTGTADDVS